MTRSDYYGALISYIDIWLLLVWAFPQWGHPEAFGDTAAGVAVGLWMAVRVVRARQQKLLDMIEQMKVQGHYLLCPQSCDYRDGDCICDETWDVKK